MFFNVKIGNNKKVTKLVVYVFYGAITTLISIITFKVVLEVLDYVRALSISWIISVTFAYFTTRKKVYNSEARGKSEKTFEYLKFVLGRVITYAINLVLLIAAVEIFKFEELYSNVIITIVIIILNYFVGDIMINKLKIKNKRSNK